MVQYFNRLKAIFDVPSGVPVPNPYVDNGLYAQQLRKHPFQVCQETPSWL